MTWRSPWRIGAATASAYMSGSWDLLHTSSTLTRFRGGLSGLQRYVDGEVGRITQVIATESGICCFYERRRYRMLVVGREVEVQVVVEGRFGRCMGLGRCGRWRILGRGGGSCGLKAGRA